MPEALVTQAEYQTAPFNNNDRGRGNAWGQHDYSSTPHGYSQPQFPRNDNQQFNHSGYQQTGPGYYYNNNGQGRGGYNQPSQSQILAITEAIISEAHRAIISAMHSEDSVRLVGDVARPVTMLTSAHCRQSMISVGHQQQDNADRMDRMDLWETNVGFATRRTCTCRLTV